jgi:hypothetical protein
VTVSELEPSTAISCMYLSHRRRDHRAVQLFIQCFLVVYFTDTRMNYKREGWFHLLGHNSQIIMVFSGMLRRVDLVITDVSEEPSASFIRVN